MCIDQVISRLELPTYSIHVRPQSNGATTTDIILESKTMLPKVVLRRSEIKSKKLHVPFREIWNNDKKKESLDLLPDEYQHKTEELKVRNTIMRFGRNQILYVVVV